jgi:hypothetical protein
MILDRYIYDELANLPLANSLSRIFIRLVAAFVPRPDVAYLLDADPELARARKPEYPTDFLHKCRRAYFALAGILGGMTIIPPLPLSDAQREVENAMAAVYETPGRPRSRRIWTLLLPRRDTHLLRRRIGCNNYLPPPLPTQPAPKQEIGGHAMRMKTNGLPPSLQLSSLATNL